MNKFNIFINDSDETFECFEQEHLLKGMLRLGRKDIPVGCRNGGCGVCKVKIVSGQYQAGIMSRNHVSVEEQNEDIALACRVFPRSDITLNVLGKMKNEFVRTHVASQNTKS
ncbi:MAG TPA: 2Fe-2S iron-sulfur cluster binding domain-containing protein [Thiotrichaceae bacterium]|nr:2Fe-2S iron-sulfur cluster binding domain-containing protein [Thiotrichaceae bacterium]HIM08064.1 2Fe-2S iron-sulfur cluster binding domain-containing protein [Gammaproteobacteria bacterium]